MPYPLAARRPYIVDRELVLNAQESAGLDAEFCLVAPVRGQLVLTAPSDNFVSRVSWDGNAPASWQPHDPHSSVLVRPDVRFGKPAVHGISTEAVREHDDAGESLEEIAEAFSLTVDDVRWALAYEATISAA